MNKILITNAHILSPADNLDITGHILIKDGLVSEISGKIPDDAGDAEILDAEGAFAIPGFVDVHTHLDKLKKKISIPGLFQQLPEVTLRLSVWQTQCRPWTVRKQSSMF